MLDRRVLPLDGHPAQFVEILEISEHRAVGHTRTGRDHRHRRSHVTLAVEIEEGIDDLLAVAIAPSPPAIDVRDLIVGKVAHDQRWPGAM